MDTRGTGPQGGPRKDGGPGISCAPTLATGWRTSHYRWCSNSGTGKHEIPWPGSGSEVELRRPLCSACAKADRHVVNPHPAVAEPGQTERNLPTAVTGAGSLDGALWGPGVNGVHVCPKEDSTTKAAKIHGSQGHMRIQHRIYPSIHRKRHAPLRVHPRGIWKYRSQVYRCGADLQVESSRRPPPEVVTRWRRKAQTHTLREWKVRLETPSAGHWTLRAIQPILEEWARRRHGMLSFRLV